MPLERQKPLVERINFGIVRVYLDDIQEIFSILKELTAEVRIQADDFVATVQALRPRERHMWQSVPLGRPSPLRRFVRDGL